MSEGEREWDPWTYNARLERVVDGDTYDLIVDLGFRTYTHIRVRLEDVDTAEMYGVDHDSEEYEEGVEQAEFAQEWFAEAEASSNSLWPLRVETRKAGKYGRWIVACERKSDDKNIAESLKDEYDL
jgi:micrococcal nuclease